MLSATIVSVVDRADKKKYIQVVSNAKRIAVSFTVIRDCTIGDQNNGSECKAIVSCLACSSGRVSRFEVSVEQIDENKDRKQIKVAYYYVIY